MQKGLTPHTHLADKNQEGYLSYGGFHMRREEVTASQQASRPKIPVVERKVPITSGCENQWGLW